MEHKYNKKFEKIYFMGDVPWTLYIFQHLNHDSVSITAKTCTLYVQFVATYRITSMNRMFCTFRCVYTLTIASHGMDDGCCCWCTLNTLKILKKIKKVVAGAM